MLIPSTIIIHVSYWIFSKYKYHIKNKSINTNRDIIIIFFLLKVITPKNRKHFKLIFIANIYEKEKVKRESLLKVMVALVSFFHRKSNAKRREIIVTSINWLRQWFEGSIKMKAPLIYLIIRIDDMLNGFGRNGMMD